MQARAFVRELAAARLPPGPGGDVDVVEPRELAGFDEPVRRYFAFMRAVGQPRVWSFRCAWTGRFRRRADAAFWPLEAWQYDTRIGIARLFRMRLRLAPLLYMTAHDSYARGRGRMRGTALGWPVVDESGPELDIGELTTWLNDAVLLAPSMLLGPETRLRAVDDHALEVCASDHGRTVTARVVLDDDGAPIDFHTTDRFVQDPRGRWQRAEWTTPMAGFQLVGGRRLPTSGRATWLLPSGPFTYVEMALVPSTFAVNVQPSPRSR